MICKFCGAQIKDDATFCTVCGKSLTETETVVGEVVSDAKPSKTPMILGIVSLVCSILTVVPICCVLPPFLTWIASLVTGIISNSIAKNNGQKKSALARAGIIISIVVGILSLLSLVATIIFYVVYIVFIVGVSTM
jgi:uncharacterized membrane protein YvbJ